MNLCQQDRHAVFTVRDSGIGIAKEHQQQVFERFFRVDRTRVDSRDPGGTGLGLPIARWIVEGHGGRIELHSEGIGRALAPAEPAGRLIRAGRYGKVG